MRLGASESFAGAAERGVGALPVAGLVSIWGRIPKGRFVRGDSVLQAVAGGLADALFPRLARTSRSVGSFAEDGGYPLTGRLDLVLGELVSQTQELRLASVDLLREREAFCLDRERVAEPPVEVASLLLRCVDLAVSGVDGPAYRRALNAVLIVSPAEASAWLLEVSEPLD